MIPILVAMMILSFIHIAFLSEFGNKKEEITYSQTEQFANQYLSYFMNKIRDCQVTEKEKYFDELTDETGDFYCYFDEGNIYYNNGIGNYIKYIIVEKETGKKFTNIKSNNYETTMDNIKNETIYWNLVEGKIETNLNYINQDNIKYNYNFNHNQYSDSTKSETQMKTFHDYNIYSFYDEDETLLSSKYMLNKNIYDFMLQNRSLPVFTCIFSFFLLIIIAFYLFYAIGYKKGVKGIDLNTLDKLPYEVVTIIVINIIAIALTLIVNNYNFTAQYMSIAIFIIAYIMGYIASAIWGITTIKRIKARIFWKSFFLYRFGKWIGQKVKKYAKEISKRTPETKKIFWYYWGFIAISILLACFFSNLIAIIVLLLFWIWIFYQIKQYRGKQFEIKEALEKIYQGNNEVYLNDNELKGVLKEMAIYINDIAGGFSNAIEESLKSERLKTELITNVSHDIKTPLTSIINYVDLLKKEDLQNEKIKEYVEILDRKSQRLKKLTEDLVEASKVSSGNVQLKIEEINLKELLNQTIGEFKDRFEEKMLQFEINMPKEEIKIQADNRYFYRIIENIFSNVTKYALENSRVYIDIIKNGSKMEMSVKNISKEKLNISSEELMQRFVRGDKSRYTEGSGLGLSIAKSLTELQGGKFNIYIDGDLFKVIIEW